MTNKNYTATLEVAAAAKEVFDAIGDVTEWWSQDFDGNSVKLNDEFTIEHPGQHYSKQKLVEVVPGKKVVWLVTESKLHWLKNKEEWTNTKMIFEVGAKGDKTVLQFTHEGLVPEKECYALCEKGWDMIIKDWLLHLITAGAPSAEMAKAAAIRKQLLEDKNKKQKKDFHRTITVNASAAEAFEKIAEVDHWWATNVTGNTKNQNDVFTVRFGKTFSTIKITECVPGKKMVWSITESSLPLFNNPQVWKDTRIVWEISGENNITQIEMTHVGLTPENECYRDCEKGWSFYIQESLLKLITEGKGLPGTGIFANITTGGSRYEGLLYFKNDPLPDDVDNSIFIDVKKTRGEEVTEIYAAAGYHKKLQSPTIKRGLFYDYSEHAFKQ